jgi:hypothetical protein
MTAIGRYVSRLSGPGMDRRRTVPGSHNALQSVAVYAIPAYVELEVRAI